MNIAKSGQRIQTLDDWLRLAPPKSPEHWVDDRSAKEAARSWLATPNEMPPEVTALLNSTGAFRNLGVERGEPEALIPFDRHSGPRHADLALWAHDDRGPVAITVEAKADEPFDDTVGEVLAAALERLVATPKSGGVSRVIDLAQSLFGVLGKDQPAIARLRYQLLTATAGTLAHAEQIGADRCVLVIHEFVTKKTAEPRLVQNAEDLSRFVVRLSRGAGSSVEPDILYGPFTVPGSPLFAKPAELMIGKALRRLGEPTAA